MCNGVSPRGWAELSIRQVRTCKEAGCGTLTKLSLFVSSDGVRAGTRTRDSSPLRSVLFEEQAGERRVQLVVNGIAAIAGEQHIKSGVSGDYVRRLRHGSECLLDAFGERGFCQFRRWLHRAGCLLFVPPNFSRS